MEHVVHVAPHMRDSVVARFIHPSKRRHQAMSTSADSTSASSTAPLFDFLCGQIRVVTAVFSELQDLHRQKQLEERIRHCHPHLSSRSQAFVLLVLCDVEEPHLDILSWLNETCLALECTLQLSWSGGDAARLLEGLAESAAMSTDFVTRRREDEPLPALIDALTQPGSQITKQDAIKLASKFGTVADILLLAPEGAANLPGFGPKKSKRIADIFQTPFGSSTATQSASAHLLTSPGTATAVRRPLANSSSGPEVVEVPNSRSEAFMAALNRHRRQEESEQVLE